MREKFQHGCETCRGFGYHVVSPEVLRDEYRKLRKIVYVGRGMESSDVDDLVRRTVERAQLMGKMTSSTWFDALFFLARDLGVLEKWW